MTMTEQLDSDVFEADGIMSISPEDLEQFESEEGKVNRIGFIWHPEKATKEKLTKYAKAIKGGQFGTYEEDGETYIKRPRFLYRDVHYGGQGVGYIHCFKGLCCDQFDPPKTRVVTLIVHYMTNRKGELVDEDNPAFEIKTWKFSERQYRELMEINNKFPLLGNDVLATCTNKQYKNYRVLPDVGSAWQNNAKIRSQVLKTAEASWDSAKKLLGNKMSEERLREKLGLFTTPSGTSSTMASDEDLSNMAAELGE